VASKSSISVLCVFFVIKRLKIAKGGVKVSLSFLSFQGINRGNQTIKLSHCFKREVRELLLPSG